jgi:hypothetical protein
LTSAPNAALCGLKVRSPIGEAGDRRIVRIAQRADADLLGARAEAQLAPRGAVLFIEEERVGARAAVRREGLLAVGGEAVRLAAEADQAFEVADLLVARLDAQVVAHVGEGGAGLGSLELGVPVVGVAHLRVDAADDAARAPFAFERIAVGLHADGHVVLGHGAVVAAVGAGRGADPALVEEQRAADRAAVRLVGRVADLAGAPGRAGLLAVQVDGHRDVFRVAVEGIDVQREAVVAAFEHHAAVLFLVAGGKAQVGAAAEAVDGFGRDAVVDHVDHAAHRAAAVLQRRGAAQHLDAVGDQRIDRHRVVVAQRRGVGRAAAVLQDADAVAVLPADDRAARVGAEVAAAHAGQVVERFAERRVGAQQEFFARERDGRRDQVAGAERIAGDGDRAQAGRGRRRDLGAVWAWAQPAKASERTATPMALRRKLEIMVNTR